MSMIMASIPLVSQLLQESAHCNGDSVHKANYTEHDRSAISIQTLIIIITITVLNLNIILKNNLIILFWITITCLSFT